MDPVSAVIWQGLDGATSVREIAAEVTDVAGGELSERSDQIASLIGTLAVFGLIENLPAEVSPAPRRHYPVVPQLSRLGKRLGLGPTVVRQVRSATGTCLRLASTVPHVVSELAAFFEVEDLDDAQITGLLLHDTQTSGRSSVQVLSDSVGRTLYTSRDFALGVEAFARTAAAYGSALNDPWIDAIAFHSDDVAVLVHPAFREDLVHLDPSVLDECGIGLVPCALVRIGPDHRLVTGADPLSGTNPLTWDLAGVVTPRVHDASSRFQSLLDLAYRWDQTHFDLIVRIQHDLEIHEIAQGARVRDLIDAISLACRSVKPSAERRTAPIAPSPPPRKIPIELVEVGSLDLPSVFRVTSLMPHPPDVMDEIRRFVRDQALDFNEDGTAYNFPLVGDFQGFLGGLYDSFLQVSQTLLGPFTLSAENKRTCFALCTNDTTRALPFHTHVQTAHINAVYYLSVPRHLPNEGALGLTDAGGAQVDIETHENELLIFDALVPHAPRSIATPELRIAINMEILVEDPESVRRRFLGCGTQPLPTVIGTAASWDDI